MRLFRADDGVRLHQTIAKREQKSGGGGEKREGPALVDPQGVDDGPVEVVQPEGEQEQDFVVVSNCAKMMNSCRAHQEAGHLHVEPAELGRQGELSGKKE